MKWEPRGNQPSREILQMVFQTAYLDMHPNSCSWQIIYSPCWTTELHGFLPLGGISKRSRRRCWSSLGCKTDDENGFESGSGCISKLCVYIYIYIYLCVYLFIHSSIYVYIYTCIICMDWSFCFNIQLEVYPMTHYTYHWICLIVSIVSRRLPSLCLGLSSSMNMNMEKVLRVPDSYRDAPAL